MRTDEQIIDSLNNEVQKRKDYILYSKFKEAGCLHLLEGLEKQRFKRVIVEVQGDTEKWYADNGTDEGELIVTIVTKHNFTIDNINGTQIYADVRYY